MKASKTMVSACALLGMLWATTGLALASVSISINDGQTIELIPGVPRTVDVTESGASGIQGMQLNLETLPNTFLWDSGMDIWTGSGPFQITGLDVDGPGCIFNANTTGARIFGQWTPNPSVPCPPFVAVGEVSTVSGSLSTDPGVAAKVTLFVPLNTPYGTQGAITTDSPILDPSRLLAIQDHEVVNLLSAQATTSLLVIPEPATMALLALGGLLAIRRRP